MNQIQLEETVKATIEHFSEKGSVVLNINHTDVNSIVLPILFTLATKIEMKKHLWRFSK